MKASIREYILYENIYSSLSRLYVAMDLKSEWNGGLY